ncbi:MAG: hypothetical protein HUJ22_12320 [Gracilimonas sp.]|uniref:CFI-box-CTERM domain-containing protein n=1 Tax=Gracilimonas sp. TaxID=1974203 RepID=UPI0019B0B6ED|nr:CFI-box-CTERM domain-containing protein [Gracilimonas sp.]MBD3617344.1 hypothetical protein [Gracilimonas sp.]
MEDLLFEIEAQNYSKAYQSISELSNEDLTDEQWFLRGIASIGLSDPDNDKTKEASMCLSKVTQVDNTLISHLNDAVDSLTKKYSQRFLDVYNGNMQKDKPDNVDYGLQMLGGDIQKAGYILKKADVLENVSECYIIISDLIGDDKKALKNSINTFKSFLNTGFSKALNQSDRTWRTALKKLENKYKELEPEYVTGQGTGEGACFIASVVYGSYNSSEVKVLRDFRDNNLSNSRAGSKFIKLYYTYGQYPANYLSNKSKIKRGLKILIFDPLVKILSKL